MGKPKELKMPKGKISMGKKTPASKNSNKTRHGMKEVIYRGGGTTDKLGRSGLVSSKKTGNTIKTDLITSNYSNRGNSRPSTYTEKITTLGQGGRRENTLTRTSYNATVPMLNNGELERYRISTAGPVKEVQHNRGSGTRKTGAKKKAY
jgi:hypothetical protein